MSIELIGHAISLYVRKVAYVLKHKGLEYTQDQALPFGNEELLKISPMGKIPVLKDDGFVVNDSSIIAQYLEKKYPESSVIPSDPQAFARVLWFDEYSDSKVTEVLTGLFFQKVAKPKFFNQEPDQEAVAEKEAQIPTVFAYLESQLTDKYIVGNEITLADFALYSNFINYFRLGESIDASAYPRLAGYIETLEANESIKAITQEEETLLASM